MRSEDKDALAARDRRFLQIVQDAGDGENKARETKSGRISFETQLIGERPAGATPADAPIVRATVGAIKAIGLTPDVFASSTDSNIAMSIGIPAVTVGYGDRKGVV